MLKAHKRDPTPVDDELAGVRSTDANHEHDINVGVVLDQCAALFFSGSGERDDVGSLEHRAEIGAIGKRGELHYVPEMRTVGIENVVVPVGFEETTVCFEVPEIGSDAISAIEYREKIR